MPRVKCDWDCCMHNNMETGYCDNSDEIELANEDVEIEGEQGRGSEMQNYLVCKSYKEAD